MQTVKTETNPTEILSKKNLTKTREKVLNRPIRMSEMRKEVMDEMRIHDCLLCTRPFRAMSRYNKVCNSCKATDRWRDY